MGWDWTDSQKRAIKEKCPVLVSASAGTGKTTVMIERIFRYLVDGGDLRRIVVLTFTNASAADMKAKLSKELYQKVREGHPKSKHLREQMRHLPSAYISTIDGFCWEIYKRYFEAIGANPTTSIIDEDEGLSCFYRAIDEVVLEFLKTKDESFFYFLQNFMENRKIDKLKETILKIHRFLSVQAYPNEFVKKVQELDNIEASKAPAVQGYIKSIKKDIGWWNSRGEGLLVKLEQLKNVGLVLDRGFREKLCLLLDSMNELLNAPNLEDFLIAVQDTEIVSAMPRGGSNKDPEELINLRKDLRTFRNDYTRFLSKLKETLIPESLEDSLTPYQYHCKREDIARKNNKMALELTLAVRERYQKLKGQEGKADFADLEHFALEILKNENIAKEFKEGIDFVYIDEYQDTNHLQEEILKKISMGNIFMVGDVKQSIYKFRLAEPKIFLDKRNAYLEGRGGTNVSLNDNFRSSPEIIEFVNMVFENIMTEDFGKINYRSDAKLEGGSPHTTDKNIPPVRVAFFDKAPKREVEYPSVYSVKEAKIVEDDIISGEALYIVGKIEELVGKGLIYDDELKRQRKIEYRDIAVIMKNRKGAEIFAELTKRKIPYNAVGFDEGVKYTDIDIIISLLKVVDNYQQDVPLVGAMLSYFGGFDEDELANIRLKGGGEEFFWQAVKNYKENDIIKNKIDIFFAKIEEYQKLSGVMNASSLISHIMTTSGFDGYLLAQGGDRIEYINAFVYNLSGKDYARTLGEFLGWLEGNNAGNIDLVPADDNCLTFSTIHKSKGLEFPIVFLSYTHQGYQSSRLSKQDIYLDDEYGLSIKFKDFEEGEKGDTLSTLGFMAKKREEEKEEIIRLVYVAMTRAKYHLFITGQIPTAPKERLQDASRINQWIAYAATQNPKILEYYEKENYQRLEPVEEEIIFERGEGKRLSLDLDYPYKEAMTIANKYSVSALSSRSYEVEYEQGNSKIMFWGATSAEMGTAYHQFMELVDINKQTREEIEEEIDKLAKGGGLENPHSLDVEILYDVLNSELFDKAREGVVVREKPFILHLPASEVLGGECKDKVLIQGIIDMLIIGKENILVDYKVSKSSPEKLKETYDEQINLYALAVEELMGIRLDRRIIYIINQKTAIEL